MSAARRCVDCESSISSTAPDYATRCRECHKNRPAQAYICIQCQGAIGDDAPSYANRCMQCYRSHRRSGDSRSEARGPRVAPAGTGAPRSLASHLRRVYEPKPAAPKPVPRQCVECQTVLDPDVPADLRSCFTCIGKQMCHRQCEECQAPIAMDAPLELTSCYKCIGKRAVAKKRPTGPGPRAPSQPPPESKSQPSPESKSPSKAESEWKAVKGRTKKPNPGCVECHAPISDTAPSYANRCYECFVSVSKRQCVSCQGPIPNSAPLQADRCGSCKKHPVQETKERDEAKELGAATETKERDEAKEIPV